MVTLGFAGLREVCLESRVFSGPVGALKSAERLQGLQRQLAGAWAQDFHLCRRNVVRLSALEE